MVFADIHPWGLAPQAAIALQKQLASEVALDNQAQYPIQNIAGVDVSYKRNGSLLHAAVVVLKYETMDIVETATASGEISFPYVPGLLSFRELPILLQAFIKLKTVPDVILADAQGIAHPRRLGLASHLGLWLGLPTIGCAKTRLCGEYQEPEWNKGAWSRLVDNDTDVGRVLRTKSRVKPLFVSPGHKVDFQGAVNIVLYCSRGYRLPEPTRQAHLLSNQIRTAYETLQAQSD
jgi:deoxyribonuclease V